jgi:hypothetical protein
MTKVLLPPGCMGFKADDGTRYVAKPGTHVDVDERHIPALQAQQYATAGLVDAGPEKQFIRDEKKRGRWCPDCIKLWHAWAKTCRLCGKETLSETEMESREVTMKDMFPEFALVVTEPGSESGGTDPGSPAG